MTKNATSSSPESSHNLGPDDPGSYSGFPSLPEKGRYTFKKKERLCQKRAFDHLFKGGSSFYKGIFWVMYSTEIPPELQTYPMMVAFAVPKRSFHRANKRNHIKRRLKEAYRLNKHLLLPELIEENKQLTFLVKYNTRKILSYEEIEKDLQRVFRKLSKRV